MESLRFVLLHAIFAFAFLHIYLGTIGNEGALEGMVSGKVDAGWGQQHHDLWYKEVQKH